ncbi:MAG: hypothetical protein ACOC22_01405 [bacterium]
MTNKSAQELYSEYENLQKQIDGLDKRITERLLFLSKKHPEAIVNNIGGVEIYAKAITEYSEVIGTYSIEKRTMFIQNIENWLKDKHPYKQLSMFDSFEEK